MVEKTSHPIGRREFIGTAAAAGIMIVKPRLVRGTEANSAVRLGLLGCGGRGLHVTPSFLEHTGAVVTALADVFPDRLELGKKTLDEASAARGKPPVDPSRMFLGPNAYQELCSSKEVDAVYVATPPFLHPEHLAATVAAGKHTYLEKPVAVDVPGCRRVLELGREARGQISLAVGFQIRHASPYVELVERIHNGQIGRPVTGLVHYFASALERPEIPEASPAERRLRNWVWDRALSGDIIVEQNIHVIDVTNWVLQGHPLKAAAAGGRAGRMDDGDCWSHFDAVYTYPNDVHIAFASAQFGGRWDVRMQYFGSHGFAEATYDAPVRIEGPTPWEFPGLGTPVETSQDDAVAGNFAGALDDADPNKQKAFIQSITSGDLINEAEAGVESALSAMLAREAAYTGSEVTWEKLLESTEIWDPKVDWSQFG